MSAIHLLPSDPIEIAADWFSRRRAGDATVPAADDEALRCWLEEDEANLVAYRMIERQWSMLGAVARDPAILAAREEDHRRFDRAGWRGRFMLAAASVLLAVTSGWAIYDSNLLGSLGLIQPRYVQDFSNAVGQRSQLALADGSTVTLDTASEVRVLTMGKTRSLELVRGRAFFKVAKDPTRPFLVHAAGRTVRAIGTEFAVRLDGDSVSVALVEGKVRVDQPGGLFRAPRAAKMSAGMRLNTGTQGWTIARFDARRETSWLKGQLVFSDISVAKATAEMNQYSERKLVFQGKEVPDRMIVGVFRAGDVEGLAQAMQMNGFAHVVARDDHQIVLSAD